MPCSCSSFCKGMFEPITYTCLSFDWWNWIIFILGWFLFFNSWLSGGLSPQFQIFEKKKVCLVWAKSVNGNPCLKEVDDFIGIDIDFWKLSFSRGGSFPIWEYKLFSFSHWCFQGCRIYFWVLSSTSYPLISTEDWFSFFKFCFNFHIICVWIRISSSFPLQLTVRTPQEAVLNWNNWISPLCRARWVGWGGKTPTMSSTTQETLLQTWEA